MLASIQGLTHLQIDFLTAGLLLQGVTCAGIPEEMILLTLGLLWGQGRVGFAEALLAAMAGLLPANALMALVGQKLGRQVLQVRPFRWIVKIESLEKSLGLISKYGAVTIFATRFIPTIRGPIYLAVGIARIPILKFIEVDALAGLLQIPMMMALGRLIANQSGSIEAAYRSLVVVALSTLLAGLLASAAFFAVKKSSKRGKRPFPSQCP